MKLVVLKIGGSLRGAHLSSAANAAKALASNGISCIVVHGGGPAITEALQAAGIELPFVQGMRVTTAPAMDIVEQVLSVQLNQSIVKNLQAEGVAAVGISGKQGVLFGESISGFERTGRVTHVQTASIVPFLSGGYIPVVSPVAVTDTGVALNVNADTAAAALAAAFQADKLIFLTDVPGIYRDFESGQRCVDTDVAELVALAEAGAFAAGMIPKVEAAKTAIHQGVPLVYVVQGDEPNGLQEAIVHQPASAWEHPSGTCIRHKRNEVVSG